MRLGERLTAARRDAQIRGAEAFMTDEQDDAHLARHFDGWVRHEYHMHPPTDPCKVCLTDEIRRLQAGMVRVLNDDGMPVWWCVGGPHDGRPHDNDSCNCGGIIVPVYRPATEVRHG